MDLRANAIITAIDRFSGPVAKMGAALNAFSGRASTVAAAGKRMGAAMSGPGSLGASMAGGAFLAAQLDFEQALNRTQAILDIQSKTDFKPLRDKIIEVATAYPAMRSEIAKGTAELAQSGMALDTIRAVLEKTVQGSMASGESIKIVGEGVTDVVLGMALPFKTAAEQADSFQKVNDILAAAATSANDSYIGFLESMRRAGPVARMVGTDITSLAAAHGVLADAGVKSERAGIALRTLQVRALSPTKKARELMRAQGVDWTRWAKPDGGAPLDRGALFRMLAESGVDATALGGVESSIDSLLGDSVLRGNLGVLGDKLTDVVADALKIDPSQIQDRQDLSDTIRRYLAQTAANLDIRALFKELADKKANVSLLKELLSLYHVEKAAILQDAFARNLFEQKFDKIALKAPGATDRFAKIMMQDFVGAFHRMKSAADAMLDTMATSGVMDTVTSAFERLTDAINRLAQTDPRTLNWLTTGLLAMGVLGPVGFALGGIATGIGAIAAALALPGVATLLAAGGLAALLGAGSMFQGKWHDNLDGLEPYQDAAPIVETWNRVKDIFGEVWGLVSDVAGSFKSIFDEASKLFGMDGSSSVFVQGLRLTNDFLKSSADSVRVLRENIEAIKDLRFSDLKSPSSLLDWVTPSGIGRRLAQSLMPSKDDLPPLATYPMQMRHDIQNWSPNKVVDVQGQATVNVKVEFVNGIPQVVNPGDTTQQVPLRTGNSLGDIGAP